MNSDSPKPSQRQPSSEKKSEPAPDINDKKAKKTRGPSRTLDNFEWAVSKFVKISDEKTGKLSTQTHVYCNLCKQIPAGSFPGRDPRGFFGDRPHIKTSKNFKWATFDNHASGPPHQHAVQVSQGVKIDTSYFSKRSSSKQKADQEFQDFVIWCAVNDIAPRKIKSYSQLQKLRGKSFKSDKKDAWRIIDSLFEALDSQHRNLLLNSFAHSISFDDATGKDNREWNGICMSTDSAEFPDRTATENFMLCLRQVNWDKLNAEGLFDLLVTNKAIQWKKVYWLCRDGASVMEKLESLIIERLAPFSIGVWCANHLNQLLIKGCFLEFPEWSLLIDKLGEVWKFFRGSNKSLSRLTSKLPKDWTGPRKPKRSEGLTRWTEITSSGRAMENLHTKIIEVFYDVFRDKTSTAKAKRESKSYANFFMDYRNVIYLVLLVEIGSQFEKFHIALQTRSGDFTLVDLELRLLKQRVFKCFDEKFTKNMIERVQNILDQMKQMKNLQRMEKEMDIEVRVGESANPAWIKQIIADMSAQFISVFVFEIDARFPKDQCEIQEGFQIFDPEKFPDITTLKTEEEKNLLYSNFFDEKYKILVDFYGTEKKCDFEEFENQVAPPPIDREKALYQWDEWFEAYKDWILKDKCTSFRQIVRKAFKRAQKNKVWAISVSEPLSLLKIVECKPNGTGEVERLMSTLNRVLTGARTSITPEHLQSLCMISHESRRMYGDNPAKIVELLPDIKSYLEKKRKDHSNEVRASQKKKSRKESEQSAENAEK